MKIIGQFNLGFIVAKLDGDLYILDQHACDEKYRFENLQISTTIHQQPLIVPQVIETTAAEEMIISENIAAFEANGFKLKFDESAVSGKRLLLQAVPFSKSVQFGVEDIHELASILEDTVGAVHRSKVSIKNDYIGGNVGGNNDGDKTNGHDDVVRLPKLLSMFASRACRSAIMVGTALSSHEMRSVVDHLSTIEQPWNCPHGRPTMRHLADLSQILPRHEI